MFKVKVKNRTAITPVKYGNLVYPFNERGKVEEVKNTLLFEQHNRLVNGGELTFAEKVNLTRNLQTNSYSKTGIPLLGVMFQFKPFLKRYFVKTQYGGVTEQYGFDKTSLRKVNTGMGNPVMEIHEVQKK